MIGAGTARLDFARCIHEIGRGHAARALAEPEARALGEAMLEGEVPPLELGAILLAYRLKGETLEELTGFMDALAPRVAPFAPAQNGVRPVILPSYNGARRLPNLTALLALSLRRHVPVLLHGFRDDAGASGRVTTAAVLRELGFDAATSLDDAKARLRRDGLAFVPTELLSPALATLLSLRERMGVRSVAHTLAKLIDPFGGRGFRVVAVTHPDYLARMRAYLAASRAHALLMRGTEGEPFAHPRRQARFEAFDDGVAQVPFDETPVAAPPALATTIDAPATAAWIADALAGKVDVPAPLAAQIACCLRGAGVSRAQP